MTKWPRGGLAVAAAVLAAGCGSQSHTQRPAVARYVTQINRAESKLTNPLAQITRAGSAFASQLRSGPVTEGPLVTSAEQTIDRALAKLRGAELRLTLLPAPTPARHLRSLVLALTAAEVALTHELALLVAYLPQFDAIVAHLQPAALTLGHVLSRSATGAAAVAALYSAKATALRNFQAAVGEVTKRLRGLQPPAVSKPGFEAQLKSLQGMASSAGGLAHALTSKSLAHVPALLVSFDRAASLSRTRAVQRAQIEAVRAYNAQSAKLTRLESQIAEERLRLDNYLQ